MLQAIYLTPVVDIACGACLDQVATYVDKELSGVDAAYEMPALHQHLALCDDCREEYAALRDLAAWSGCPTEPASPGVECMGHVRKRLSTPTAKRVVCCE